MSSGWQRCLSPRHSSTCPSLPPYWSHTGRSRRQTPHIPQKPFYSYARFFPYFPGKRQGKGMLVVILSFISFSCTFSFSFSFISLPLPFRFSFLLIAKSFPVSFHFPFLSCPIPLFSFFLFLFFHLDTFCIFIFFLFSSFSFSCITLLSHQRCLSSFFLPSFSNCNLFYTYFHLNTFLTFLILDLAFFPFISISC